MLISSLNSLSNLDKPAKTDPQAEQIAGQEAAAFWQQLAAMRALAAAEDDDKQQREQAFGQHASAQQHATNQLSMRQNGESVTPTADSDSLLPQTSTDTVPTASPSQQNDEGAQSAAAEQLLNRLFEQLLANRLGIDQQRIDELKQKLQDLEQLKQQLSQQAEQAPAVAKQLKQLDEQMLKLNEELATLVKQATERMKQRTADQTMA